MRTFPTLVVLAALGLVPCFARDDAKQQIKEIRELAKNGSASVDRITALSSSPDLGVRVAAVEALIDIGTARSLEPLIAATRDSDSEVQIRAVEGLVNFYSPGYVRTGGIAKALLNPAGTVRARLSDTSDLVVDPWVEARPDVVDAVAKLLGTGTTMGSRAAAARAAGVLRAKPAVDGLLAGLRSKDDTLMRESILAIQKIKDPATGERILFLLRDLNAAIQLPAIETVGMLRTREALPDLRVLVKSTRGIKVRRGALTSVAMISDAADRALFLEYLADADEGLRAAAAEGLGRLKQPEDLTIIDKAFESERKMAPRLSAAFAAVALGHNDALEFSPLRYLVNTLNSAAYRGVAQPFLTELAHNSGIRRTLYSALEGATRDEKVWLARVFAETGDRDTEHYLEALAKDPDSQVAGQGVRSLKVLRNRL